MRDGACELSWRNGRVAEKAEWRKRQSGGKGRVVGRQSGGKAEKAEGKAVGKWKKLFNFLMCPTDFYFLSKRTGLSQCL